MKEVIIIIFYFILLLAVHGNTYQCPDCIIPCVPNPDLNVSASHLLQTFHHRIRDLTLLTFLDAINGDVRFMSSNGRDVFSKTISLTTDGYTMSELCSIFSNPPRVLRTSPHPKIKFRYFPTCLLSNIDESGNFYLFEKMSLLLIEQRDIIVQLRDVKSDIDVLNYTVRDNMESFRNEVNLSLKGVELKFNLHFENAETAIDVLNYTIRDNVVSVRRCDLQYEDAQTDIDVLNSTIREVSLNSKEVEIGNHAIHQKIEMRKKLEYALLDARVYGTTLRCFPTDYRLQLPMSHKDKLYCRVEYPNWMYFKLLQEFEFNVVQIYLYDADSRVITYSIDISRDGISWTSILVNYKGKRLVTHRFSQTYAAQYLRMQGDNTVSNFLTIYWVKLDLI